MLTGSAAHGVLLHAAVLRSNRIHTLTASCCRFMRAAVQGQPPEASLPPLRTLDMLSCQVYHRQAHVLAMHKLMISLLQLSGNLPPASQPKPCTSHIARLH